VPVESRNYALVIMLILKALFLSFFISNFGYAVDAYLDTGGSIEIYTPPLQWFDEQTTYFKISKGNEGKCFGSCQKMLEYLLCKFPNTGAVPQRIKDFLEKGSKTQEENFNNILIAKNRENNYIKVIFNTNVIIAPTLNDVTRRHFYRPIAKKIYNSKQPIETALQEIMQLFGDKFEQIFLYICPSHDLSIHEWQTAVAIQFSIYLKQVGGNIFDRIEF
jgi:hypothetical protein